MFRNNSNVYTNAPGLAALADNSCLVQAGAPGSAACVQTQALNAGSPALDAAKDSVCEAPLLANNLDQRGVMRGFEATGTPDDPETGDCDIGAYELIGDRLIIEKQTLPDGNLAEFSFSGALSGDISDGEQLSGTLAPGQHTVSETVPVGWDLTDILCDDEDVTTDLDTASIGLTVDSADEFVTVTCTFTNTERGTIIIDKVTLPSGSEESFTFTPSYNNGTPFDLTDAATPNDSGFLLPGSYTVSELVPAGWDLTEISCDDDDSTDSTTPVAAGGTAEATVNLAAGETVTCTFTNTERGRIDIRKQTLPDGAPGSFDFSGDLGDFSLQDNGNETFLDLPAGATYTISEADPGPNFHLSAIDCDDPLSLTPSTFDLTTRTATVGLDPAELVICTFSNSEPAQLNITTEVLDFDPGAAFDFSTQGGLTPPTFSLQNGETQTFPNLLSGQTYTVNDEPPAGWTLAEVICSHPAPVCEVGSAIVTPEPGQDITATFRFRLNVSGESQNIPTLNGWGLGGLIGLFGLIVARLRRRR